MAFSEATEKPSLRYPEKSRVKVETGELQEVLMER